MATEELRKARRLNNLQLLERCKDYEDDDTLFMVTFEEVPTGRVREPQPLRSEDLGTDVVKAIAR